MLQSLFDFERDFCLLENCSKMTCFLNNYCLVYIIIKCGGLITSFAVFSTPTMRTKTTGLGSKERYCHDLFRHCQVKEERS